MVGAPSAALGDIRGLMALMREGETGRAREAAESLLAAQPDDPKLLRFLGLLRCQTDDLAGGITLLARAMERDPGDAIARRALVHALADIGDLNRALSLCTPRALARDGESLWRLRGHVELALGSHAAAATSYEQVLRYRPDDAEGWSRLGDARHASGDAPGAAAALRRAFALQPADVTVGLNLAVALVDLERTDQAAEIFRACAASPHADEAELIRLGKAFARLGHREEALGVLARAARDHPAGPAALVETGLLHAGNGEEIEAEAAYRAALDRDPLHGSAYLYLGLLFEHSNRADELVALVREASAAGVPQDETALLRALSLRRSGAFDQAANFADAASETVEPARRAQLIGELADRLGNHKKSFAAFAAMNRMMAKTVKDATKRAMGYRASLAERLADLPAERLSAWPAPPPLREGLSTPTFLMGFPRSGTTLLDTLLMGHPEIRVLEELPIIQQLDASIGGHAHWASLGIAELGVLRQRYFEQIETLDAANSGRSIIDKHPLHIAHLPLINLLFPKAPLIFVERHPCDVVLSCFTTNFAINDAMANFLELTYAAELYDLMMRAWSEWGRTIVRDVHIVRYEELVLSPAAEMRRLLQTLSINWDESVLDHRLTAAGRGYIASASYAQVGEAIHSRSIERWRRYREQLAPVLPILAPWVQAMGYSL